jgi:hypothetical protein
MEHFFTRRSPTELFQKFDKLLVEPRLNIRQQISTVFALKLEGEFKNQTATQIVDFEDDFLG